MSEPVYILGAGMHPWGKWGNDFTEYGVAAARAALREAGLDWRQIQLVAGADTIRNGYPGFVAGATFAQKLGWNGVPVSSSYAACASGSQALQSARAQILAGFCDVALVIGADTTPKGFFAPVGGERKNDPDWQRFHLIGATNPVYFALLARRRMDLYGATLEDFAQVKVKNARHGLQNPNARFRKETSAEDVLASLTEAGRYRVYGWTVLLHNTRLGYVHPGVVARNAWGDPAYYSLCPAQPLVRDYAVSLCGDLAEHYDLAGLTLETPGFLPFVHGYHHEFAQLPGNPWMNVLLGLCFCDACMAGAAKAGIDSASIAIALG